MIKRLLVGLWDIMGKEHNRLTFIVSFVALLAAMASSVFVTCDKISEDTKTNSMTLIAQLRYDGFSVEPCNESQRIISATLFFSNRQIDLNGTTFTIDTPTTDIVLLTKKKHVEFPVAITAEYISNGEKYNSKAEYIIRVDTGYSYMEGLKYSRTIFQKKG